MSDDPRTDRFLVEAYLRGRSEHAFRQLYRRHATALYRFVALRVGADAAEDVVQDTWVRATRRLDGFQWRSSLRSWLTGIALNCCRERWRQAGRVEPPAPTAVTSARSAGLRLDLVRALGRLPERSREVLMLHDIEGLTHQEIGEVLEIEAGTSKSQLSRARAALRGILDGQGERKHG